MARGTLPCDVAFVGEAPGESEDVLGVPFIGPAGKLLDHIIARSIGVTNGERDRLGKGPLVFSLFNLVGCIPRDEQDGKAEAPDDVAVRSCSPRLQALVKLADPRLLVTVGSLAEDYLEPGYKHSIVFHRPISRVHLTHPAAILRLNIAQRNLLIQRCIVTLSNAVEDL